MWTKAGALPVTPVDGVNVRKETSMPNFLQDIERVLEQEKVERAVIGNFGGYDWGEGYGEKVPKELRNRLLTWEETKPLLDYEYDDGFGGAECNSIYAWTATRVIFVSEYDGSTTVTSLPRNPCECSPTMLGG